MPEVCFDMHSISGVQLSILNTLMTMNSVQHTGDAMNQPQSYIFQESLLTNTFSQSIS